MYINIEKERERERRIDVCTQRGQVVYLVRLWTMDGPLPAEYLYELEYIFLVYISHIWIYMYMYIYIYIERERDVYRWVYPKRESRVPCSVVDDG